MSSQIYTFAVFGYDALASAHPADFPPALGYRPASVHYVLDLSDRTLTALPPEAVQQGTKTRQQPQSMFVPTVRRNGTKAYLCADLGEYVLPGFNKAKHASFLAEFELMCSQIPDLADALTSFVSIDVAAIAPEDADDLAKSRVVLRWQGCYLHDRADVQRYWQQRFIELSDCTEGVSCLTGQTGLIPSKGVYPIRGVPNTNGTGAALTSYDKPAFCSYGLEASDHAPLTIEESFKSSFFLELLIKHPQTSYRLNAKVFVFAAIAHGDGVPRLIGIARDFWDSSHANGGALFAYLGGQGDDIPAIADDDNFFLASFAGNSGRIASSRGGLIPARQLRRNLEQFIDAQFMHGAKSYPIWRLVKVAFADGVKNADTDYVHEWLIAAALYGDRLPVAYVRLILDRLRVNLAILPVAIAAINIYLTHHTMNHSAYQLGVAAYWMCRTEQQSKGGYSKQDLMSCHAASALINLGEATQTTFRELNRMHLIYCKANPHEIGYCQGKVAEAIALAITPETPLPQRFSIEDQCAILAGFHASYAEEIALRAAAKRAAQSELQSAA